MLYVILLFAYAALVAVSIYAMFDLGRKSR